MVATCCPFCCNFSFSATFSACAFYSCSFRTISSILSPSLGDSWMIIGLVGGVSASLWLILWLLSALEYIEFCIFLFALEGAKVPTTSLSWGDVVLCCEFASCSLSATYMTSISISSVFPWPFVSSSPSFGSSYSSSSSPSGDVSLLLLLHDVQIRSPISVLLCYGLPSVSFPQKFSIH